METDLLLSQETGSASESRKHPKYKSIPCEDDESQPPGDENESDAVQHAPKDSTMTTAQKKLLACLVLVKILNGSLVAVMIPFFPVEAASRGVSQMVISCLFGFFALAKLILSPFVGGLVSFLGINRLYNLGIAIAGISTIVFGTLSYIKDTSTFVAACFLVRLVEAVGSTAITICGFTIVGIQFSDKVNRVMALLDSALTIGLALTPAIWGGLFALGGFGTPFYTLGVIILLMAVLNQRLMPTIEKTTSGSKTHLLRSLRLLAGSTGIWVCLMTEFMYAVNLSTVDSTIAPYANDVLGVPPSQVGLFYLVSTMLYAMVNFFWGWLADRVQNPFVMMSPCLILASVATMTIAPSALLSLEPAWWITGLGLTGLEVFAGGAVAPCFKATLDSSIESGLEDSLGTKALVASVYQMSVSMGIAVGPLCGGIIVDSYGFPWMTTLLGFATATVGLLAAIKAFSSSLCIIRDGP